MMKRKEYNQSGTRTWLGSWTVVSIFAAAGMVLFALMWLPVQSEQDDSTWRYVDNQVQQLLNEENGSEESGKSVIPKQSVPISNNGKPTSIDAGAFQQPGGHQLGEDSPASLHPVQNKEAVVGSGLMTPSTQGVPHPATAPVDISTPNRTAVPQPETRTNIVSDTTSAVMSKQTTRTDEGMIHINSASEQELTSLPGIGPSKAKAIIAYREKHGMFKAEKDLLKVKGIGSKLYAKIKGHVSIQP